ncbi:NTF2 fold immunity protein [Pasteurella sp. PK-2025]|uniref:NTF2 fold immunity protein n=1 Tax=Pasteurella sp. PK-2025 TaxID=3413133 RepID=UPI003C729E48
MENAKKILFDFFDEMYLWNKYAYQYTQENGFGIETQKKLLSTLEPIVKKFCTKKISEKISIKCSEIPKYDKNNLILEKCDKINKNKIIFYIRETNRSKSLYKYTLINKDEIWQIDKKDWFVEFDNKWEKHYI